MEDEHQPSVADDFLIWVDVETFGLKPWAGPIIEWGWMITTPDAATIVSTFSEIMWSDVHQECFQQLHTDDVVFKMHTKNGLWEDAHKNGRPPEESLTRLEEWLNSFADDFVEQPPMCGSSVWFDRVHLEAHDQDFVKNIFSHRNIDISSIKELCKRLSPDIYAGLDANTTKRELHRSIPDLEDTLSEYRFYLDNFIWMP